MNALYDQRCVNSGGSGPMADTCCGSEGDRKPFNSMTHNCCDGRIKPFGGC